MPSYAERRDVPYSAAEMFALVADIETYPEFLPWCTALRVRQRERMNGQELLMADMAVAFKVVSERFTTRVLLDPHAGRIDVRYINGPFRALITHWRFEQKPSGGSTVDFFIDFEFRSRPIEILVGAVFTRAVGKLVNAFEERAATLYGGKRPLLS